MAGLVAGRMQSDRPVWALLTQSISAGTRVEGGRLQGQALMSTRLKAHPLTVVCCVGSLGSVSRALPSLDCHAFSLVLLINYGHTLPAHKVDKLYS